MVLPTSVVVLAMLAGPASARSLTIRSDPDDTHGVFDIRKVSTDASPSEVFIQITTWDRLRHRDASFSVLLDTRGSPGYDRAVETSGGDCVVEKWDENGLGAAIGRRHARFPGTRNVDCSFPAGWFKIHKTVRFFVKSGVLGSPHADRAPNDHLYQGL
jgi:hypothetical protein